MKKDTIYSILFYIVGIIILSFGITMLLLSDFGVGPWDAFFVGLYNQFGLTVGSWIFIVGVILVFVNSYLLKSRINLPSLLTFFITGLFIDFWMLIVFDHVVITDTIFQVALLIFGIICMGAGIGSYMQLEIARNPIDNLMIAVNYRTGLSLALSKMSLELMALLLAFIIKGPIGIGTFVIALGIGPLVQFFYHWFKSMKGSFKKATQS